jgi:Permuted papain-like amidase enzyme, YaeF/YiiX, C92 family
LLVELNIATRDGSLLLVETRNLDRKNHRKPASPRIGNRLQQPSARAALIIPVLVVLGGGGWLLLTSISLAPDLASRKIGPGIHFESFALASGDVIFRRGRSLVSRAVLSADGGSEYSHVGIVSVHGRHAWVIHSIPAEHPSSKSGVIVEPIQVFLSSDNASAAAVYRPRNPRAARMAEQTALKLAHAHIPFDAAFDLSTPNALYCTELVWRVFLVSGVDLRAGTNATLAATQKERYLLPSRLEKSPELLLVKELKEEIPYP